MKSVVLFVLAYLAASSALAADSPAQWQPAAGPLMTRWAKDVSPAVALPDYPRPQLVRDAWLNLNGLWDYAIAKTADAPPQAYDGKILVPFCVESALSGVMREIPPEHVLWYRRSFEVPKEWTPRRTLLHFGAVDWEASVWVNGQKLASHRGGYDSFTVDVTDALKPTGPQELVVVAVDPTDSGNPQGKQTRKPGGIFYTSCSGIWQTVWLEPVDASGIERLQMTPDVDAGKLRLIVTGRGAIEGRRVEAVALEEGKEVARLSGNLGEELALDIPHARLWSPDSPFLYDLKVAIKEADATLDAVSSYFGMRKYALGKDEKGTTRFLLNNERVFQVGPLDQGFWPDGIYTAPTDEALRFDIEVTKRLGFTMTRKHVKIEPERWYYWCDKLGLPVWQDMVSPSVLGTVAREQFEIELKRLIEERRNHPSILLWVVFNEGWGQFDTERLTQMVKTMDPSRLVTNASGWTDAHVGDVADIHFYPGPRAPKPEANRATALGEFGGLGLAVEGHMWPADRDKWSYQTLATSEKLSKRYGEMLRTLYDLQDLAGLGAAVYTQLTDVETEFNGLLSYDRAVVKVDVAAVAAFNQGRFPTKRTIVAPTAEIKAETWRYTFDKPADDWCRPGFDDSSWNEGPAGFGSKGTPNAHLGTTWKSGDIWLRRTFKTPAIDVSQLQLRIHHDDDAEVYLNGVLAAKLSGCSLSYDVVSIAEEAQRAIRPGEDLTIAVHCAQNDGGQYIDVGLSTEK